MRGGKDIRQGETLYILQDGKPVSKLQVTQTYHTKVKAKVISTTVTITKGMSFGRWKEGKKEAEPEPVADTGNFSAYQGKMNWNDARAKCASIKMRLPTREELFVAYKAGLWEKWQAETAHNHSVYWTSEEYSVEDAYDVFMNDIYIGHVSKVSPYNVRCVR